MLGDMTVYMISRRLAGLLINFKESDWPGVLKTRVQNFVFKGPRRTGCNLGQHKIKCILSYHGVDSVQM